MVNTIRVNDIPMLVEHQITILVQDVPCTHNYYTEAEVVAAIKRLKAFGKKYEMYSKLHIVH